jgi:LuxR family maltose regulon positive regulatory protein
MTADALPDPLTVEEAKTRLEFHLGEAKRLRRFLRDQGAGGLSDAERRVAMVAGFSGLSAAEIGRRLYVSPETVRTQLKAAYRKLGVEDRAGLRQALLNLEQEPS